MILVGSMTGERKREMKGRVTMSEATPPAYFRVQIKFKNFEESMQRYGGPTFPIIGQYGGEMIAGSRTPKVVEGNFDGNWAAVLRFSSMATAEAWFNSPEYRPLKGLRVNELTDGGRVLLLDAFDPTAM